MQTVYIVISEALHHDSSYYDIVEVCSTREKAEAVIKTQITDTIKQIDSGDFGEDFNDYFVTTDFSKYDYSICSPSGYHESWQIMEMEVL